MRRQRRARFLGAWNYLFARRAGHYHRITLLASYHGGLYARCMRACALRCATLVLRLRSMRGNSRVLIRQFGRAHHDSYVI